MEPVEIEGDPEILQRELPEEGKYFEVIWTLNYSPEEEWNKEFDKLIKKYLEIENPIFGPYKPKINFNELILTLKDKEIFKKQKEYYQKEFLDKINSKFH